MEGNPSAASPGVPEEAGDGLHIGSLCEGGRETGRYVLPLSDLLTHVFICGITGSGKTVLGKALLEEAALRGIPCIALDLKGDISSLAIKLRGHQPADFLSHAEGPDAERRQTEAETLSRLYREGFARDGLTDRDRERFNASAEVAIFTPLSERGIRLGVPLVPDAPANLPELRRTDPEAVFLMIDGIASNIVRKVLPEAKAGRSREEHALIVELIAYAWNGGRSLRGPDGLKALLDMVRTPPFPTVGAMAVDDFLETRRRLELARRLNSLLVGVESLWQEGTDVGDVDALLSCPGSTPVRVVNLSGLDSCEDRNFVVAQTCLAVYNWMFRQGGASLPRLLLFIDEIGGGGGAACPCRAPVKPAWHHAASGKAAARVSADSRRSTPPGRAFAECPGRYQASPRRIAAGTAPPGSSGHASGCSTRRSLPGAGSSDPEESMPLPGKAS